MPVTVVQPGFVNGGGGEQASEATERGRIFFYSCMKKTFVCTLNLQSHTSPPFFFLLQSTGGGGGGGGMCPCAHASDSGAARICQRGTKTRERSNRAGDGVGGGLPSPIILINFINFVYENDIFLHIKCHY